MKVVILAGGLGTRISEESIHRPKPMIEIGGKPILWHLMKIYSEQGFNDFVICLGYKAHVVKDYFANYYVRESDLTFDFTDSPRTTIRRNRSEPWKVTLVDTGEHTMTGGRLKRIKDVIGNEAFLLTYGDGLANVNIHRLLEFHRRHGKLATLTAVQPPGRFGVLTMADDSRIELFQEKPPGESWINGGFFAMEPEVLERIEGDSTVLEEAPLRGLAMDGQLMAFKHFGFWQPMDTLRDRNYLHALCASGNVPWMVGLS
ncbi:glucose-1-phosphate cytidylyltransferase [Cohnella panacarvi]|uniref:glucose-1-phosphate cytidylyltransferase n=1 Tax=Cohnella panacarvi TaxID=400776 RepID=UPI00047D20FC|nr:glucose-1-phosphate cytidylyltransferase [Cohnella panacarvi]